MSRIEAEKKANPGYRAFLANGFNVSRAFVLFIAEVVIEWVAAARAIRRDVRPRGHRGGSYPFLRGALCVIVRDLIVFGVLSDMMRGRAAVYATFSSYDEVFEAEAVALFECGALGLAVIGEHDDLVRARGEAARSHDPAELLVELAQRLHRVGAL